MAGHSAAMFQFLNSQRKVMTTLIPYRLDWVLMQGTNGLQCVIVEFS
jgi:hypothetical protein